MPEIKPQATVSAGGYYAPAKPQLTSGWEQFGRVGEKVKGIFDTVLAKKAQYQSKEDYQTGARIALAHMEELRKDSSNALKQAEKNGWIPNGARPDVKQGYLKAVGVIWADSPQLKGWLNEGMETFINDFADTGGTESDFHTALDARTQGIVAEARDHLDDNFYTRDEGFMGAIGTPLAQHRKDWTAKYHAIVSRKQRDVATKATHDQWGTGGTDRGFNYWWTGDARIKGDDSDVKIIDSKTGKELSGTKSIIAPADLYPVDPGPRVGFYNVVRSYALFNLAENQYDIGGVDRALRFVDIIAAKKNPSNGARMDSGTMDESYTKLKRELQAQRAAAQKYLTEHHDDLRKSAALKVEVISKLWKGDTETRRDIVVPGLAGTQNVRGFRNVDDVYKVVKAWETGNMPHPFREGEMLPWDVGSINEILAKNLGKEGTRKAVDDRQRLIDEGYVLTDAEKSVFTGVHMHQTLLDSLSWIQEQGLKSRAALKARGEEGEAEFKRETVGDAENLIIDFFHEFENLDLHIIGPDGKPTEETRKLGTWTQEDLNAALRGATEGLIKTADELNIEFDTGTFTKDIQTTIDATHKDSKIDRIGMEDFSSVFADVIARKELWMDQPATNIRKNILELTRGKRIDGADVEKMVKMLVEDTRNPFKKFINPHDPTSVLNKVKKQLKAELIRREKKLGILIKQENDAARANDIWDAVGDTEKWLDFHIGLLVDKKFTKYMTDVADKYSYDTKAIPANLIPWLTTSTEKKDNKPVDYPWGEGQLGEGIAIQSLLRMLLDEHPVEFDPDSGEEIGGWRAARIQALNPRE